MERFYVAITFDVDMYDYVSGAGFDEFDVCFARIQNILQEHPQVRTTWFLRIDAQIEANYGAADYIFRRHAQKVDWLRSHGHEIGWHHHPYRFEREVWVPESCPEKMLDQIARYGEIARSLGLESARMGWGYQTTESMYLLDTLGFSIDSSAIPRPCYPWESPLKDWSRTEQYPYRPSVDDYQTSGVQSLRILEVPMTTTQIYAPGDDLVMKRCINLAYKSEVFCNAIKNFLRQKLLVTITHPYEFLSNLKEHPLLSFSYEALRENVEVLKSYDCIFINIKDVLHLSKDEYV